MLEEFSFVFLFPAKDLKFAAYIRLIYCIACNEIIRMSQQLFTASKTNNA